MPCTAAIPRFKGAGILTPALRLQDESLRPVCLERSDIRKVKGIGARGKRRMNETRRRERFRDMWALCNGSAGIDPEFRC